METLTLTATSKNSIIDYREKNHLVKYEYGNLYEIIKAIEQGDLKKLEWLNQFGDAIRCITMNVYAIGNH